MNYVDTQLYIPHKVECDSDIINEKSETDKTIQYLNNLVELNYISITDNSLNLTKSGHDYFMRKCNIDNTSFHYDKLAPMEIQQMIFEQFFAGKPAANTVEKFIKTNLTV